MKPCTILDSPDLIEIANTHFGSDTTMWVLSHLNHPTNKLFKFDDELFVLVEAIGDYKFSIHTIGYTRKVSEYRDFTINIGSWMMDNTSCTCMIAFAAVSNKRMQRFIGLTGGQRVGIIPDAGGHEDEIMYVYPKRDRDQFERRVKCQQQLLEQ